MEGINPFLPTTPAFCHLYTVYCQFLRIANPETVYKLQDALTFFLVRPYFSHSQPHLTLKKNIIPNQKISKLSTWPIQHPCLLCLISSPTTSLKVKLNIAHAPPSSPVRANDALVANLFGGSQGASQNKRLSLPREKSGHTPARKKHGRTTHCASSVKAGGAIRELLAALHVDDSFDRGAGSLDLHRPIVTPDCNVAGVGDLDDDTSNDENYHPTSGHVPPPPFTLA
jgi:hypothetical protein